MAGFVFRDCLSEWTHWIPANNDSAAVVPVDDARRIFAYTGIVTKLIADRM